MEYSRGAKTKEAIFLSRFAVCALKQPRQKRCNARSNSSWIRIYRQNDANEENFNGLFIECRLFQRQDEGCISQWLLTLSNVAARLKFSTHRIEIEISLFVTQLHAETRTIGIVIGGVSRYMQLLVFHLLRD